MTTELSLPVTSESNDQIVLFKCIVDFIHALKEMFGEKQHSLELYDLLMEKTGIIHQEPIKKHIHLFYQFVSDNQDSILERNKETLKTTTIQYSEKVFIDIDAIFKESTIEDEEMIWKHLLTLLAILIPTSNAKQILQSISTKKKPESINEENFLTNIMKKVGNHIDPSKASDPAAMMSDIMESGVFTELVKDMNDNVNNGSLDIQKMMGNLQGMLGNLSSMMNEKENLPKLT